MLLTHLCSGTIDLAAEMLITLRTEAPVAITPALFLFAVCWNNSDYVFGCVAVFFLQLFVSLFPVKSEIFIVDPFSQKKEARIKRGDWCACFIIREKRNRKTRHGLIFSMDRRGKATPVQRLCTETEPDLFNF